MGFCVHYPIPVLREFPQFLPLKIRKLSFNVDKQLEFWKYLQNLFYLLYKIMLNG